MTVLQVLNDSKYDELTIQNRVYDEHGYEHDFGYCLGKRTETGWELSDCPELKHSICVHLYDEICGFHYSSCNEYEGGSDSPMLVVYTPVDLGDLFFAMRREDSEEVRGQMVNDGYEAFVLNEKYQDEKYEKEKEWWGE